MYFLCIIKHCSVLKKKNTILQTYVYYNLLLHIKKEGLKAYNDYIY